MTSANGYTLYKGSDDQYNSTCVLVTCDDVHEIKEFTTDGQLLREVILPQGVLSPSHTVQLSSGEFIVCHSDLPYPLHLVCV